MMRCTGYCTALSYDISRLFQLLQTNSSVQMYRDVIHQQSRDENGAKRDVYYFPYGVVVFWGLEEGEEKSHLAFLSKFEKEPLIRPELDEFSFSYGEKIRIVEDEIVLHNRDVLTKLAISYAIGQSVKLTVFEELIAKTVESSKQVPKELALRGKISLSRKETSRKMGELFLERTSINLHTDILDTPEFFWEHSELEPLYRRATHYLDVSKRVDLLNRRLNLMHELFEILGSELNHQQTSRLEMTIVILIVIEVILVSLRDLFHLI